MIKKTQKRKYWLLIYFSTLIFINSMQSEKAYAINDGITVSFKNELLSEAIKKLEEVSGYSFAYQSDILPKNYRISKTFKNAGIEQILSEILNGTGIYYQIVDKHVVIKKKKKRKKYNLSGYIGDAKTGKKLVNVNVYDKESRLATITNEYGYYSLSMPEGVYTIALSYIGMEKQEKQLVFDRNRQIDFEMNPNLELEEVLITDSRTKEIIEKKAPLGKMSISPKKMTQLPLIMGEPDMLKYVQLLPGMQSGMEASGALYVRGGNASHNLILMDYMPIYNCYHFLGLFSVFNPDMVGTTDLYKGAFPAKYGGRLSSVIDMGIKEGNFKEFKGSISLGLISSKFFLEGPLIADRTSYAVSGRLGYYHLFGGFLTREMTDKRKIENYYFTDANVKLTHKFLNGSKAYATFYNGVDFGETINEEERDYEPEYEYLRSSDGQKWYNIVGTVGWNGKLVNKLFANFQVGLSNYIYNGDVNDSSAFRNEFREVSSFNENNIENKIESKTALSEFALEINPKIAINFGYRYKILDYLSKTGMANHFTTSEDFSPSYYIDTTINYYQHQTQEHTSYIDLKFSLFKNIQLNVGVHSSYYLINDYSDISFQPRVNLNWEVFPEFIFKASYSQMVQHMHHLEATRIKRASDLLVPALEDAPSETSNHYSVGASYYKFRNFNLHIEAYYKDMDNLVNFKEGVSFFNQTDSWEEKVETGKGNSKGIEFLIEKDKGNFTGWLGYTLSESDRQFKRINMGAKYPFRFEHRHHLNVLANYKISDKWSVSANWVLHSGNKETIPKTFYWSTNEVYDKEMLTGYKASKMFYNQKNSYINPCYHRLDLAVNYKRQNRLGNAKWCLSLYNVYNRQNVYSSSYDEIFSPVIGSVNYYERVIKEHKFLGIIPSLSYTLSF